MNEKDDFYIGWQDSASPTYSKARKTFFLFSLLALILFTVIYLAVEKPFIDSYFDYGNLTELEGTVVEYPVFGLQTTVNDQQVTVPLVGFGKFDALPVLEKLKTQANARPLSKLRVTLRGTLIQYQEKTWMELTEGDESIINIETVEVAQEPIRRSMGEQRIPGEIVDPKCFFGVMNPAYKKIHRACAVRCISGGIPPILAIREGGEFKDYYFILDEKGQPIHQQVLPYVGVPVSMSGEVEEVGDWKVLKVNWSDVRALSLNFSAKVSSCRMALNQ